jgi:protoporphyrinogen oxidase
MDATLLVDQTLPQRRTRQARELAIVGGGMLGLVLALRYAQAGRTVTLFEAAPFWGGLAAPWKLGDVEWDRHYHVILSSDMALRSLLEEIGLADELRWTTTRTGFFVDGGYHELSSVTDFLRFAPLSMPEKIRLGAAILYASRKRAAGSLEDTTAHAWLRRLCGARTYNVLWEPLLRSKLGEEADVSASFIAKSIARLYGARKSGTERRERFGYVVGGYARIIGALVARLESYGVVMRSGTPISAVKRMRRDGDNGFVLETAGDERFGAHEVIVTAPSPRAGVLCAELPQPERETHTAIRYQGIVCMSLVTSEPINPYYITNITDRDIAFSAIINMSAIVERDQFGGRALTYLPKYVAPDDAIFGCSDDEIAERFLRSLEAMHPEFKRSSIIASGISRVPHVFPLPTLDYTRRLPPIQTSHPGLAIVNSAHITDGTLNVDRTIALATQAFRTLCAERLTL